MYAIQVVWMLKVAIKTKSGPAKRCALCPIFLIH